MKYLSKVLSLALVVALSLGLIVTAGAKTLDEYPDKSSIGVQYLEAVELLTALGVFQGDDNGNLYPQSTFTRAQAAKIVSYITIGSSANNLTQAPTQFDDVPATHWASGYVAFATERGIINGVGNNMFAPDNPVTGSQLAKLLLVAIGYGAKGEYTGSSWELNAIVDGQRLYILTGEANHSEPATREQAIQYVFNALSTQIVSYNSLFDAYLNASESDYVTRKQTNLAEETFTTVPVYDTDDFGYSQRHWTQYGVRKTADYGTDVVIGTVVSNPTVTKGYLYSTYQWNDFLDVHVNGYQVPYAASTVGGVTTNAPAVPSSTYVVRGDSINPAISESGVKVDLIDVYPYDGKVGKIVATYEYLAKVTSVNATGGTIGITVYDENSGSKTSLPFSNVPVDESFAKNDYLVVVPRNTTLNNYTNLATGDKSAASFLSVKRAEVVTATPTSYTTSAVGVNALTGNTVNSITINGEKKWIVGTQFFSALSGVTFTEATFYLDSNGYIVGTDATRTAASTLNYLLINATTGNFASANFADNRLSVTFPDGTKSVVEGYVASNPTSAQTAFYDGLNNINNTGPAWYSYTVNSDGKYIISALPLDDSNISIATSSKIESTSSATTLITAGSAIVSSSVSSSSYYSSSTVLKVNGRSYTGYSNFPTFELPASGVSANVAYVLVVYGESTDSSTGQVSVNPNVVTNIYIVSDASTRTGIYGIAWYTGDVLSTGYTQYWVYTLDGYETDAGFEVLTSAYNEEPTVLVPRVVEIDVAADGTRSIESGGITSTVADAAVSYADSGIILVTSGSGTTAYYISSDTLIYDAAGTFAPMAASEIQAGWKISLYYIGTNGASNPAIAVVVTSYS
jgi:hypothetical protein